jgi:hypothetical protein
VGACLIDGYLVARPSRRESSNPDVAAPGTSPPVRPADATITAAEPSRRLGPSFRITM